MVEKNLRRASNISTRDVIDVNKAGQRNNNILGAAGIMVPGNILEPSRTNSISSEESEKR